MKDQMQTYKILLDGKPVGIITAIDRDSAARITRKKHPEWFSEEHDVCFLLVKES